MDGERFDGMARMLGGLVTRRRAVGGAVATAVAAAIGGVGLDLSEVEGARKRKKKKDKRCLRAGKPCSGNKQCCPDKTGNICDVPTGGSNSDTFCCGDEGSRCGGANEDGDAVGPKCCARFSCSTGDPDDPDFEPNTPGRCLREMDVE
jgi:hypothetical protein